jgi:hypothetical protein
MLNGVQVARWACAILLLLFLHISTDAASLRSVPSKAVLLSPNLASGQKLVWRAIATDRDFQATNHGPVAVFVPHYIAITCSVTKVDGNALTLTRSTQVAMKKNVKPVEWARSPLVIQNGQILSRAEVSGLDPLCMLYARVQFGNPPSMIRVGTSWKFAPTGSFGLDSSFSGVTTVESLDAVTGVVGLRIDARYIPDQQRGAIYHIILGNGGVIESETVQADFHNSANGSTKPRVPYYVADWKLERS